MKDVDNYECYICNKIGDHYPNNCPDKCTVCGYLHKTDNHNWLFGKSDYRLQTNVRAGH